MVMNYGNTNSKRRYMYFLDYGLIHELGIMFDFGLADKFLSDFENDLLIHDRPAETFKLFSSSKKFSETEINERFPYNHGIYE